MVFYIFTGIVFFAEIVLACAAILFLLKMNKKLKEYSSLIGELNPNIKDLLRTLAKLSEQMVEFAPMLTDKIKTIFTNIFFGHLKSALGALVFWLVKTEVEKHAVK